MDVKKCTNYNLNFQAGLTCSLRLKEFFVNVEGKERMFGRKYGTTADFQGNKAVALANTLCADIFEDIGRKLNIELSAPPMISVFDIRQLRSGYNPTNFCIFDTKEVLKKKPPFIGGSLFFMNYPDLKTIDSLTENAYRNNRISSNHFLSVFIHEWIHSMHLDYLYRKFGYPGDCEVLKQIYPKISDSSRFKSIEELSQKVLSDREPNIVKEQLGLYASKRQENQYFEVFSEAFTKLICSALSKDCTHVYKKSFGIIETNSSKIPKNYTKSIQYGIKLYE